MPVWPDRAAPHQLNRPVMLTGDILAQVRRVRDRRGCWSPHAGHPTRHFVCGGSCKRGAGTAKRAVTVVWRGRQAALNRQKEGSDTRAGDRRCVAHQPPPCAPTTAIPPLSRAVTQWMDGSMSRCSVEVRRRWDGCSLEQDQRPGHLGGLTSPSKGEPAGPEVWQCRFSV